MYKPMVKPGKTLVKTQNALSVENHGVPKIGRPAYFRGDHVRFKTSKN